LIKNWFNKKSIVLDVGCGTGVYTTSIAIHCEAIVGLDASTEMVERGLSKAKCLGLDNINFVVGDVAHFPFRDRVFDLAFSVNLFHHIIDENITAKGFLEKVRCIRKGGHVLVYELNPNSLGWSNNLIPQIIRGVVYSILFPFQQQVIDNVEEGTRMINASELMKRIKKIKVVLVKVGGFIPTYCPKFLFNLFVLLERIMEVAPLLRGYGAHVLVVGEVQ
jgi:ubiquinone/menaquinone biosynthesis C-methylase UbiE